MTYHCAACYSVDSNGHPYGLEDSFGSDDWEIENNLRNGHYSVMVEHQKSRDDYLGLEYEFCATFDDDTKFIASPEEFAHVLFDCDIDQLERSLFKYTESGISASWTKSSITLCGCVEGSDCDGPMKILRFPTTEKKVWKAIREIDRKSCIEWHNWNWHDVDGEFTSENGREYTLAWRGVDGDMELKRFYEQDDVYDIDDAQYCDWQILAEDPGYKSVMKEIEDLRREKD